MDKTEFFAFIFAKRDILRQEVVCLVFETFQKWELLLKERLCSKREKILSFKSSPQWEGRQIFPC